MRKANFFLVGAAKSGTTSVYDFLNRHPQAFMSPVKEPNYFSTDIRIEDFSDTYRITTFLDTDTYFSSPVLKPLQLTFVRAKEHYSRLFEKVVDERLIGECSTSYLFSENAAEEIYSYNPEAKIVIVIRNPIQRAYSHYLMALKYGFTNKDFLSAVKKDERKELKAWGCSELFIELGLYSKQIERYFNVFGRANVQVMFMEDMCNKPQSFYDTLCNFSGIEKLDIQAEGLKSNSALIPKFPLINKFLVTTGVKKVVKQFSPNIFVKFLKSLVFNSKVPVMTEQEKSYLKRCYEEEVKALSVLLNKDLKHWLL